MELVTCFLVCTPASHYIGQWVVVMVIGSGWDQRWEIVMATESAREQSWVAVLASLTSTVSYVCVCVCVLIVFLTCTWLFILHVPSFFQWSLCYFSLYFGINWRIRKYNDIQKTNINKILFNLYLIFNSLLLCSYKTQN